MIDFTVIVCLSNIIKSMKFNFGGGGGVLDDYRSITKSHELGNPLKYMPDKNSLKYYVQASEERM